MIAQSCQRAASDDSPVVHIRLSGQSHIADLDYVIADTAVMSHMRIGHDQAVVAYLGKHLSACGCSSVDGRALADDSTHVTSPEYFMS